MYIAVEKKNRELQSKLLVSLALLEGGAEVVVGFQKSVLAVASLGTPGVVFYKGLNKIQHDYMMAMSRAGHLAVAIDEESLASSNPKFLMLNCWSEIHRSVDKIFCQGELQRQALIELRGLAPDQLVLTGNPRIDLLRSPATEWIAEYAEGIRREHGPFVLINTDYGSINNATMDLVGFQEMLVRVGYVDPTSTEDLDLMEDRVIHDQNAMASVEALVLAMDTKAPGRKLVLRPHPTESDTVWQELARRVKNLTVITGTRAPEWILAADCMIQTGCTTGVEAAILGTPTIGMVCQPDGVIHPDLILTHRVNPVLRSVEAVVEAIGRLDAGDAPELAARLEQKRLLLEPHVHIDADEFAYEHISRVILDMAANLPDGVVNGVARISDDVDRQLRQHVTRARFGDAYFSRDELETELTRIANAQGKPWRGSVRDLGWGTYALSTGG